jgi:hypothetical protein
VWFILASLSVAICLVSNFALQLVTNAIREHIDNECKQEELNRTRPEYQAKSIDEIKALAYFYEPKWQNKFLSYFFTAAVSIIISLGLAIFGNLEIQRGADKQTMQQRDIINKIDSIYLLNKRSQSGVSNLDNKVDTVISHLVRPIQQIKSTNMRKDTIKHHN